jgi:hypothetical protein
MKRTLLAVAVLSLLLAAPARAARQNGEAESAARAAARAQAEESGRAFMVGDFARLLDHTYARVVELGGGRERLLAQLKTEADAMRADGFEFVSYEAGEAGRPVALADTKLTAVFVPVLLKLKAGGRIFSQQSYLLGVSADGGRRWTFISGSGLDAERLKLVLPEAGGRLKLPEEGELKIESQ